MEIKVVIVPYKVHRIQELLSLEFDVVGPVSETTPSTPKRQLLAIHVGDPSTEQDHGYWEVAHTNVVCTKKIGGGASASVFIGELYGIEVAIKKWDTGLLDAPPDDFVKELAMLRYHIPYTTHTKTVVNGRALTR